MKLRSNLIKSFPANSKGGTDYAVGDIHGCYSKLMAVLALIKFDPEKDRLFCVGDLCDRGPESAQVLDFLDNDWIFSLLGNHEQILFTYEEGHISQADMHNVGAGWWLQLDSLSRRKILDKFLTLPIVMDVQTKAGKVGLLHGECPVADWNKLPNVFLSPNRAKFLETILWGTGSPSNSTIIKNIDAIVVGHMTQHEYKVCGNVHLIDTGAVYQGGKFTILNLDTLEPVYYFV